MLGRLAADEMFLSLKNDGGQRSNTPASYHDEEELKGHSLQEKLLWTRGLIAESTRTCLRVNMLVLCIVAMATLFQRLSAVGGTATC